MLVQFTVENFRSYHTEKTFTFVASPTKELPNNLLETPVENLKLLRSAAIYGANASGKSNLLAAMHSLHGLLQNPMTRERFSYGFSPFPFVLARGSAKKPTRFTVKFFAEEILYEYHLAVKTGAIEEEVLFAYPSARQQEWFRRKGQEFKFNDTYLKGKKRQLESFAGEAFPYLGIAAAFDQPQLSIPANWLLRNLGDRFSRFEVGVRPAATTVEKTARRCQKDKAFNDWTSAFLQHADLGIKLIEVEVTEQKRKRSVIRHRGAPSLFSEAEEVIEERYEPYFVHAGEEGMVKFGLHLESHGTRRLFAMIEPVFDALRYGLVAIIDELSASMHPVLVIELIRMFHDPQMNPLGAQLLFTTHDTAILSGQFFRRDQVWFTEKNASGETDLYSLYEFKEVREGSSFAKGYLRGKYGAIPFFTEFNFPPAQVEGIKEEQSEPQVAGGNAGATGTE